MKYAVIYKESYTAAGYDACDSSYTAYYDTIKEFDTEQELMDWVTLEDSRSYGKKTYRVIQFEALKVNKSISFELAKS